eukprot:11198690-Lingulodinium_polyedra.AAC.1
MQHACNVLSTLALECVGPLWSWMTPKPVIKSYCRRSRQPVVNCNARAHARARFSGLRAQPASSHIFLRRTRRRCPP